MSTLLKLKLSEYEAMVDRGEFDGVNRRRVELIRGELREMSPIGPSHDNLTAWLNRWSVSHTAAEIDIRVQGSLCIPALESVPQPDLAWTRPGQYGQRHPGPEDVLLVIEVSRSSLKNDLGEKKELYAEAGVQEYWVVDVDARQIHVFRSPSQSQYQESFTVGAGQTVAPQAEPHALLDVGQMFSKCAQ